MHQVICWFVYIKNWFVYIGKNPRFTAFLDGNLHTRLAIMGGASFLRLGGSVAAEARA